jgi:hypothetical protein
MSWDKISTSFVPTFFFCKSHTDKHTKQSSNEPTTPVWYKWDQTKKDESEASMFKDNGYILSFMLVSFSYYLSCVSVRIGPTSDLESNLHTSIDCSHTMRTWSIQCMQPASQPLFVECAVIRAW